MAAESNMMELGTIAPDFNLLDVMSGKHVSLAEARKEYGIVVMFICAHCPYVKNIEEEIAVIAAQYANAKLGFVARCFKKSPDQRQRRRRQHRRQLVAGWFHAKTCMHVCMVHS